jgi:branched-chain amino acid transport system permease protein
MALAFNQIGFFLVLLPPRHITNGEDGFGAHARNIGFLNFNSKVTMFILTLLMLLLVFILKRLTTPPYGILVRSIKEDENRVRFLGYNTYFYKWYVCCRFADCRTCGDPDRLELQIRQP